MSLVFMRVASIPGFVILVSISLGLRGDYCIHPYLYLEKETQRRVSERSETPHGSSVKEYFHEQRTTVASNTVSLSFLYYA